MYTPKSAHDLEILDLSGDSLLYIRIFDEKDNVFTYEMKMSLSIIDLKADTNQPPLIGDQSTSPSGKPQSGSSMPGPASLEPDSTSPLQGDVS